jgi:hypothetical protein
MHRIDDSDFLLFIEPKKKSKRLWAKNDIITKIMQLALFEAKKGSSNYMYLNEQAKFFKGSYYCGYHITECGKESKSHDYQLENGMITNSLCVYYLQYYRKIIPKSEMKKVNKVVEYYKEKYKNNPEIFKLKAKVFYEKYSIITDFNRFLIDYEQ